MKASSFAPYILILFGSTGETHGFTVPHPSRQVGTGCRPHDNIEMSTFSQLSYPRVSRVFSTPSPEVDGAADTTSAEDSSPVPLVIEGKNLEVTEALSSYVDKRIRATLEKLSGTGSVRECDVILSVSKNPKVKNKHRAEVVTNVKGTTIICTVESPDMYSSIDSVAHALTRKLRKYKERRQKGWHGGSSMGDDLQVALEALEEQLTAEGIGQDDDEEDDFVDPEAPDVTKINSFQLDKPINLEEAIFALDYVDHDFYVFTNEDTKRVNVVYKRHGGGVGLIES